MTEDTINPKAVQMLERGIKSLQKKNYKQAMNTFTSLLDKYPGERSLRDRANGYIKTCERMTAAKPKAPTKDLEILTQATYHLNRQEMEEALALLEKAKRKPSIKPTTTYTFAIYYAVMGEQEKALASLAEAIALDESCRYSARSESDFSDLAELPEFQELVG